MTLTSMRLPAYSYQQKKRGLMKNQGPADKIEISDGLAATLKCAKCGAEVESNKSHSCKETPENEKDKSETSD